MLYWSFTKQELVIGSFEESFKTELDIFKPLRKKKKKPRRKAALGSSFHIKNTGYQENKRVFVFQGVIGFAVHNRPYGGRLDSSLSVKRPPVHER